MRDELAFGYNASDDLPASRVLADGLDDEDDVEPSEDSPSQQPRFYARVVRDVRQPSGAALPVAVLVTPRGSLVASAAGRTLRMMPVSRYCTWL